MSSEEATPGKAGGDPGFDLKRMSVQQAADALARQVGALKRARLEPGRDVARESARESPGEDRQEPTLARGETEPPRREPAAEPRPHPFLRASAGAAPIPPAPPRRHEPLVAQDEDRIGSPPVRFAPAAPPRRRSGVRSLAGAVALFVAAAAGSWAAYRAFQPGTESLPETIAALWRAQEASTAVTPNAATPKAVTSAPENPAAPAPVADAAPALAKSGLAPRDRDRVAAQPSDTSTQDEATHGVAAVQPVPKPNPVAAKAAEKPAATGANAAAAKPAALKPVARAGALQEVPVHAPAPEALDLATKPPTPKPLGAKPFVPTARPFVPAAAQPFSPAAQPFNPTPKPFVPSTGSP